ncbi:40S ribosomal protein S12-A [Rosa chinensis]|uniref:40S ribosomal protein S12-A n=1 Tax=Rosa chinensis TaxID=74649 RepID=UPI001AD8AF58|nr:40S ribosomal protein S12-A [Rosa chinensis]
MRFTIEHCFIRTFKRMELEEITSRIDLLYQEDRFGIDTDFIIKPEYDYLEIDQPNYANIEEENMSLQGGPHFKNFVDLLRDLLAMALANGLLRRGLPTASNLIPDQKVWLCVFAEDSNQDDFVKAVKSLCEGYHVEYLTIASAKTLGQWSVEGIYETELHKAVLEVWKSLPSKLEVLEESGLCRPFV